MKQQENTGRVALKAMSFAPSFNKWMYSTISPYTKGKILEIGSGLGNISKYFLQNGSSITLSDIDAFYIQYLKTEFQQLQYGKNLLSIDLQKKDFNNNYNHLAENFDTVILLNVLEHLEDDASAIRNCKFLLKNKGTIIILVPAYSFLFSEMDKALHHYRRYTAKKLVQLICKENFLIEKSFYFNALGIGAWLYGKLMKYKAPPDSNMKFFDMLTPFGKLIDRLLFQKTGLSAIVLATKNESTL